MSLIEGTDFNAILIKHAMELQQQRERHVEAKAALRREWKVNAQKDKEAMESIISDRDADIEALKHRIETAEERHRHLQESVEAQRHTMQERQERRDAEYRTKAWEIERLNKKCRNLEQLKLNLRHQVLKMKLDATGGYNESLVSLINRLKQEIEKLHADHESLQQQYGSVALERTTLRRTLEKTNEQKNSLQRSLRDQRIELEQTAVTLKRSIRRRAKELQAGHALGSSDRTTMIKNFSSSTHGSLSLASSTPRRHRRRKLQPEQDDDDADDDYGSDDEYEDGLPLPLKTIPRGGVLHKETLPVTQRERRERRERITSAGLGRLSTSLDIETREMFPPTPKKDEESEDVDEVDEVDSDNSTTLENDKSIKVPPLEKERDVQSAAGGWDVNEEEEEEEEEVTVQKEEQAGAVEQQSVSVEEEKKLTQSAPVCIPTKVVDSSS